MMNKLSFRQQTLVNLAQSFDTTIDVGCDHGYIGVELLKQNKTKFLFCSDISEKSVNKAKLLIKKNDLKNQVTTLVGDGLWVLEGKPVDQVIVAGMGGLEIKKIVSEYSQSKKVKYWIFQPMNELFEFRKFLSENNFFIEKDFIILDKKKFYHIICAQPKKEALPALNQKWGKFLEKQDKTYFMWLKQKKAKIERVLKNLPKSSEKQNFFKQCKQEILQIEKFEGE